jgi:hypothetical protein
MAALYSLHGSRPAPLPFRITLPDGFTRTDPNTFTEDEIVAAGFTGPFTEPTYDPATERLDWIDGAYAVSALPPPPEQPRWVDFFAMLMADASVNALLGALLQAAPAVYGGLVVGLQKASEGDTLVFLNSWHAAQGMGLVSDELIATMQHLAALHDLPQLFIDQLQPQ